MASAIAFAFIVAIVFAVFTCVLLPIFLKWDLRLKEEKRKQIRESGGELRHRNQDKCIIAIIPGAFFTVSGFTGEYPLNLVFLAVGLLLIVAAIVFLKKARHDGPLDKNHRMIVIVAAVGLVPFSLIFIARAPFLGESARMAIGVTAMMLLCLLAFAGWCKLMIWYVRKSEEQRQARTERRAHSVDDAGRLQQ